MPPEVLKVPPNVQQESSPVVWSASRSQHVTSLQPWQTPPNKQFQYQNVQLLPQGSLSIGSYGKVCKELNQLPCAVKLLHPVLFQFEQECEFLSEIRPPHIDKNICTHKSFQDFYRSIYTNNNSKLLYIAIFLIAGCNNVT